MSTNPADSSLASGHAIDRKVVDLAVKLMLLGLFAYWSLTLIAPFAVILIWAAIFATAVYPLQVWLRARLFGHGTLASLLITLFTLALILGPSAALVASLAGTVEPVAHDLMAGTFVLPPPTPDVRDWPVVGVKLFEIWGAAHNDLSGFLSTNKSNFTSTGKTLLGLAAGLGGDVLLFAVSVVIAGFLYSRGPQLAEIGRRLGRRAGGERGSSFVDLAGATVRNVSRGVVGISLLQALLAGIGLMVAGIPAAGVITVGVLILAIIQIGPALLLIPVTIWVWVDMETLTAVLFTIYMIPVLTFDNILKPIVMSRGLKTPMLVIFVGVIGGTLTHGLIGLFLGPIVLAVFYELFGAWLLSEDAQASDPATALPPA